MSSHIFTLPDLAHWEEVNPYLFGHYIYSVISDYFVNKYNLQYTEKYPKERVTSPAITWRVLKRKPGTGRGGTTTARGPSYEGFVGVDMQGQMVSINKQFFTIYIEYAIFGTSSDEVDIIGWDLELALDATISVIQNSIPGFNMSFSLQTGDTNDGWQDQDEMNVRTILYEVTVPVRFKVIEPQLREVILNSNLGREGIESKYTRTSSDKYFDIPVPVTGGKVVEINRIINIPQTTLIPYLLGAGVDYQIARSALDQTIKIKWLDDIGGSPPQVGDTFIVNFFYAPTLESRSIRGPSIILPREILLNANGEVIGETH